MSQTNGGEHEAADTFARAGLQALGSRYDFVSQDVEAIHGDIAEVVGRQMAQDSKLKMLTENDVKLFGAIGSVRAEQMRQGELLASLDRRSSMTFRLTQAILVAKNPIVAVLVTAVLSAGATIAAIRMFIGH